MNGRMNAPTSRRADGSGRVGGRSGAGRGLYPRVLRPALYRLGGADAEDAHRRTLRMLAWTARHRAVLRMLARLSAVEREPRTVFGVEFPSPVGLAAGADKDGVALAAWPALGFGFVEAGTVTAVPQPGNPRPRVIRLPASGAVINRMGFPNSGAAALARRASLAGPIGVPLGISLGKSKSVPASGAVGDYLTSLRAVHEHADYIAVNVSSPNTPGLRRLQDRGALDELLAALLAEAVSLARPGLRGGRPVPLLVKISPDLADGAMAELLDVCTVRGVAGVIAVNTTLQRSGIASADASLAAEGGGLSGPPLLGRTLEVVRFVSRHSDLPVIGVGGISRRQDAMAMFDAGASLLQIYTGLIYAGPALLRELAGAAPVVAPPVRPPAVAPPAQPLAAPPAAHLSAVAPPQGSRPSGCAKAGAAAASGAPQPHNTKVDG